MSSESSTENQITIDWDMPWQYAEFRGNVAPRTAVLIGYVLRKHEKTGLSPYQIYKLVKELYIEYLPNFTPPTYDEIRTDLYVLRHVKPPLIKRVGIVQSTNKPYFSKILYALTPEGKDPRYDYIWWDPFEVFKSQRGGKRKTKRARQFGLAGKTQKEQMEETKEAVEQQEAETQTATEKGDRKKKKKPAAEIEVGSGVKLGTVVDALIGSALRYFVSGDKRYIDGVAKELKSLNIALDIDYVVGKIAAVFDDLDLEKLTVASDEKVNLKYPENTNAALRLMHDRLMNVIDPNNMTDTVANAVSKVLGEVEAGGFDDDGALVISERIADALSPTDIANIYVALADKLLGTEAGTRYYLSVLSKLYKKYEAEPFGEQRDPRKIKVNAAINDVAKTIYDKYFDSDKIKHLLSIMHSTVGAPDMGIDQYREYVNDRDTFVGDFRATIMTYG